MSEIREIRASNAGAEPWDIIGAQGLYWHVAGGLRYIGPPRQSRPDSSWFPI